jgi:hypothetical protein
MTNRLAIYAAGAVVLYAVIKWTRSYIMDRFTALNDVERLAKPRSGPKLKGTAIVVRPKI